MSDNTVHVTPRDDAIEHDLTDDCLCGPTAERVPNPDGPDGWLVIHHSLDGREKYQEAQLRFSPMAAAMKPAMASMAGAFGQFAAYVSAVQPFVRAFLRRHRQAQSGPPPLSVDGHDYRRRTRRRKP